MERHLTVSGFVVHKGRVALYWHRKLEAWMPSGGHIEPNEDPIQATLRELREEFRIEAEVLPFSRRFDYTGGPTQLEAPHALLDCWAKDHWHVNMVYFCRHVGGYPGVSEDPENPIVWLDIDALGRGFHPRNGCDTPFAPDVQALAIASIRAADATSSSAGGKTDTAVPRAAAPTPRKEKGPGGEVALASAEGLARTLSSPSLKSERGLGGEVSP